MSSTAATRKRLNGDAAVYNDLESLRERIAQHETKVESRLEEMDHKLTTCLTILELLGTQAGLLKGK
jgi:hypothetical protein